MSDPTVQITVLKDNQATRPELVAGHGLALLVETEGTRVLFDTGPDETLLANAAALGLRLYPLDAIVLSHGHTDHTGGLAAMLEVVGPVKVVAQPGVFDETFSGPEPGQLRSIGMPLEREAYEALGARFELSQLPVALGTILMTTGHIAPRHLDPRQRAGLWRNHEGVPYPDDFGDDCSLLARLPQGAVVITGCAHAGLVNILCKAQTIVPDRPPQVLIGGLHLGGADEEAVAQIAREIAGLGVCAVMPCHCTGDPATQVLADRFPGKVVPVGTGSVIRLHEHNDLEVRHPVVPDSSQRK